MIRERDLEEAGNEWKGRTRGRGGGGEGGVWRREAGKDYDELDQLVRRYRCHFGMDDR